MADQPTRHAVAVALEGDQRRPTRRCARPEAAPGCCRQWNEALVGGDPGDQRLPVALAPIRNAWPAWLRRLDGRRLAFRRARPVLLVCQRFLALAE
jgi:hypothetical protein